MAQANGFRIRAMRHNEIAIAIDWAAAEGWNPGHADALCFACVDPDGFLIGELDGGPAATISCVNYDARFAFLGFYIVRPDLRGRGYGLRIWNAAIAHAAGRTVGLDGVPAQQENYRKSGFRLAHSNIRYGGVTGLPVPSNPGTTALTDVALASLLVDDSTVFPAQRGAFLQAWISAPGHVGRALVRDGRLCGWGVIRPCRVGWKSVRWSRTTAPRPRRSLRPWSARPAVPRYSWIFQASIAMPSPSRTTMGWRRCSRPRGCTPDRSIQCVRNACSASPRSNWAEPFTEGAKHVRRHIQI